MLTLLYSPHMTSTDNEAKWASGHADVPLSARGQQEAAQLGQYYQDYQLDAVFSSDLQRAASTSRIAFGDRKRPIILDARLRELDYGDLTQFPTEQIDNEFARHITKPFPQGESVVMVAERVGAWLREVLSQYDGKTIVVIGHRATKYGLDYWSGNITLKDIVLTPWEWRDIPIWRYEFDAKNLIRVPGESP